MKKLLYNIISELLTSKKARSIVVLAFITVALVLTIRQNLINTKNLRLHGIILKAKVYDKSSGRSTNTYYVVFRYGRIIYRNKCRSSANNFVEGDSIKIKINSKDPSAYCEVAR